MDKGIHIPGHLAELRRLAEETMQRKPDDSKEIQAQSSEEMRKIIHEFEVYHVDLEMQQEELQRIQRDIEAVGDKYSDLYDFAPIGYLTVDKNGVIQEANLTGANLLGCERGFLIERPFSDFVARDDQEIFYMHRREVFATRTRQICETKMVKKDGTQFHAHIESLVAGDRAGNFNQCRMVITDVTEQMQSEEVRRRLATAVEYTAESIILTNRTGTIQYVNPAFERISGYTSEEVIGKHFRIFKSDKHDEDFYREMWNMLIRGEVWSGRIINRKKDGELCKFETSISPIRDSSGAITSFVSVNRDVTHEIQLEEQLRQAQKMEAIGVLAGGIAHDFNNLLQTVQGYVELLRIHKNRNKPFEEDMQEIVSAVNKGRELTHQLLTFSRKVESNLRPLQLNYEVEKTKGLLQRIIPKMIEIELHLQKKLKIINADPTQIEQILLNLAVNAKDAMPGGGKLTIQTENMILDQEYCRSYPDVRPGKYVLLMVSDTGKGIEKETQEHIFDPFFTTKGLASGTGLGLSMVYGIVKNHKGHIECASEPGKGATFKIYLPAIDRKVESEKPAEVDMPKGGSETILIVDDEEAIVEIGRQILTHTGYTVLSVPDGDSALEFYREKGAQIDLIILDLIMPGIGGIKCLQELLKINPEVKVLATSGYSDIDHMKESIATGALSFIGKPFDLKDMLNVVREVLDKD